MAACGGLEHIFEKPLSETPTFLESLSAWKHIKPIDDSSVTEIFGELHFKESHVHSPPSTSSSSSSSDPTAADQEEEREKGCPPPAGYSHPPSKYTHRESISSESLSLCTEGLGFESFEDVEHDVCDKDQWVDGERNVSRKSHSENHRGEAEAAAASRRVLPPPISCIGRCGTPGVCFRSYKEDGRFILREIRIPTQEFLHACRQDGRLKLQFIHNLDEEDEVEVESEDDD